MSLAAFPFCTAMLIHWVRQLRALEISRRHLIFLDIFLKKESALRARGPWSRSFDSEWCDEIVGTENPVLLIFGSFC